MGRFLTAQHFIDQFGEAEARQIAGDGNFNSLEGSQIDMAKIEDEITYADELIAGYVLARNGWLSDLTVEDMPNLLRGLGATSCATVCAISLMVRGRSAKPWKPGSAMPSSALVISRRASLTSPKLLARLTPLKQLHRVHLPICLRLTGLRPSLTNFWMVTNEPD